MALAWILFMTAYVVTSGLAAKPDEEFKEVVLEEIKMLKMKYSDLERRFDESEAENKEMKEKLCKKTYNKRQTGYIPEQEVAFSASVSQHLQNLSAHQTILFGRTLTNIGGFYNNRSGVFYVPVSGTYLFFTNILSEADNSIETELIADSKVLAEIYSGSQHFHGAGSNLVIAHLKRGTNVWVKVHAAFSTNMAIHCCWSTFSGYLLRENTDDSLNLVG